MCIRVAREYVTTKPIRGWKNVRVTKDKNVFKSGMKIANRSKQLGCKTFGRVLEYRVGRVVESPFDKTAGIYVYSERWRAAAFGDKQARIEVVIPAGTRVRVDFHKTTLCAERIKVVAAR